MTGECETNADFGMRLVECSYEKLIFTGAENKSDAFSMIFLTTIRTTNQLAMALEVRRFGLSKERTSYQEIEFKKRDYGVLVFLGVVVMTVVILMLRG